MTKGCLNIVQFSSVAQSFPALCSPTDCSMLASLSFAISRSLLKLMSVDLVTPFNHLILCRPLLLLPSLFPSNRFFSHESASLHQAAKVFSFSTNPSKEYSGLISFRMDWLDLLAVQGTRVFSNTTVQKHQFFSAQLSLWSNFHIHT